MYIVSWSVKYLGHFEQFSCWSSNNENIWEGTRKTIGRETWWKQYKYYSFHIWLFPRISCSFTTYAFSPIYSIIYGLWCHPLVHSNIKQFWKTFWIDWKISVCYSIVLFIEAETLSVIYVSTLELWDCTTLKHFYIPWSWRVVQYSWGHQ